MRLTCHCLFCFGVLLLGLWSPPALSAISVNHESSLSLSPQIAWCQSKPSVNIEQIVSGQCQFSSTSQKALARGISRDAFWLRFTLTNPSTHEIERWLQIGHPRLQLLSLYQANADGSWHRTDTGMSVPTSKRPIASTHPMLPITLASGESGIYYLRVVSESAIHLEATLWEPIAQLRYQQGKELFQVLALGGLMLATVFTLMVFYKLRDRTYLYFGATLFFEIFQDMGYTGVLQAYLWPDTLPFPLEIQAIFIGLTLIFFTLFVRSFLEIHNYQGTLNRLLILSTIGILLSTLWACFFNYGEAIQTLPLAVIGMISSCLGLFVLAWRGGYRSASYLVVSFCILMLMLVYRALVAYGVFSYSIVQSFGFSWYFLFTTPLILAGTLKRSEEFHEAFIQSRADVAARISFMAKMSHEFRSPLNTILGYAELQERGIQNSTAKDSAAEIKRSGRHLLSMIDEILEHSRGEAGQLQLEPEPINWFSFLSMLEQTTAMMVQHGSNRFQMIKKGEMPVAIIIDERRLRQVLDNLLSNANRYTDHGQITLLCESSLIDNTYCQLNFSVQDTGAGIAPNEFETILQPFVRGAVGKSSGIDGNGMGLAIVQQLLGLMGSQIHIDSKLGKGSVFSFSIQCALASNVASHAQFNGRSLTKTYTVLLVDDDLNNQNLLRLLLVNFGFKVLIASSANDAKQYLGDQVDLVVSDQFMAHGDGWNVLQDWWVKKVPVILLSAAPPKRPEHLPDQFQFSFIHLKPFDIDALLADISEVLAIEWQTDHSSSCIKAENTLIKPPLEMLSPLKAMIDNGAVTDIGDWLNKFRAEHPEYRDYCDVAMNACLALDFKTLIKLVTDDSTD
ncbi:MAG: hybrid sensor histidine kinase/response regulator [Methylotenera sp.]|nr:hybrid sensor histidine kinase/response regulator [Methylotenera sp.]